MSTPSPGAGDGAGAKSRKARPKSEPVDADAPLGSMPSTSSPAYAAHSPILTAFDRFASAVTRWAGTPLAFCAAVVVILAWAAVGPVFGFSENWQLVINTGTTIVTFLMVFLIQNTQNRDTEAIQIKLDELIRATQGAHNALLDLEELEGEQLDAFQVRYQSLASAARARLSSGLADTGTPDT